MGADLALEETLRHFDVTTVHDARLAVRKCTFGAYDVLLAFDARGAKAPLQTWNQVRQVDRNTPFVMICGVALPPESAAELRAGFDAVLGYPCSAMQLMSAIRQTLAAAEERNLQARALEARAVSEEIKDRLTLLEQRVHLSRQSLARAQEHVMRAVALRSFTAYGGTRSHFDDAWPQVFESAVAASYGRREEVAITDDDC